MVPFLAFWRPNLSRSSRFLLSFDAFFFNMQIIPFQKCLKNRFLRQTALFKGAAVWFSFEMKNRTLADGSLVSPVCPVCSQFFPALVWYFCFFCSTLLFILILSLFCFLSSVFSQAKKQIRSLGPSGPVVECHLVPWKPASPGLPSVPLSVTEVWRWGLTSATHSSFHVHPSSSEIRKVP